MDGYTPDGIIWLALFTDSPNSLSYLQQQLSMIYSDITPLQTEVERVCAKAAPCRVSCNVQRTAFIQLATCLTTINAFSKLEAVFTHISSN